MRKMKKPPAEELRKKKEEPLAEGLQIAVPTDSRGRLWSKMSDEEMVEYAKKVMKKKGITRKIKLIKADHPLYEGLRKRRLIDKIEFEEEPRSWKNVSDKEIIELARKLMNEHGILLKKELYHLDRGLHSILYKRGLLGEVGFEERQRSWENMSNVEVIEFVKRLMKTEKITGKTEFEKFDRGLFGVLRRRGLLDEVGFEEKKRKHRSWKDMDNEEIVEYTKKSMEKEGIQHKDELVKLDRGLYSVLYRRNLLGEVGFVEKQRDRRSWKDMDNEGIIEIARNLIKEKGITLRGEFRSVDSGLYEILRKREIVELAFADADQQKTDLARDAVIDALDAFAANDNNSAEDDVA